jgi:hypothetical protein
MTNYLVLSGKTGRKINLVPGDTLTVQQNGTVLQGTDLGDPNHAVIASYAANISNSGVIHSLGGAAILSTGSLTLDNTATGQITSNWYGLELRAGSVAGTATVNNAGAIYGEFGGIKTDIELTLMNSGVIESLEAGNQGGNAIESKSKLTLINTGTLRSNSTVVKTTGALTLTNSNLIENIGSGFAVSAGGPLSL